MVVEFYSYSSRSRQSQLGLVIGFLGSSLLLPGKATTYIEWMLILILVGTHRSCRRFDYYNSLTIIDTFCFIDFN